MLTENKFEFSVGDVINITTSVYEIDKICKWLQKYIGKENDSWAWDYQTSSLSYSMSLLFKYESDRTLYVLKWRC